MASLTRAEKNKQWRRKYPEKKLVEQCRNRANRAGIECTILPSDITIPTHCPVLGIPLRVDNTKQQYDSASVDRIDNTKGYTPDNIIVVSWRANMLKRDSTVDELKKVCDFYSDLLQKRSEFI